MLGSLPELSTAAVYPGVVTEHRTDPLLGAVLDGRYDVRARLARGGMSTVYLALDLRLEREVALKVLFPHLAEDLALVRRFEQEAKTAARLSHPHVVNVLDQGVHHAPDGEVAYLAMEYVPGYTLRTVLRQGALSPRIALAYLDAIVDGLAAAHRAGLVHRDMKPENVLVSRDGRIKVADFGLARAASQHTGTGATLLGTVAYVSPELVQGRHADERSDVYAVGIMAYELLTGVQPYQGSSPIQVAYQHIQETVPPPSGLMPGLARELDELVQWCTAPDPEERPADAAALLTEVRRLRATLDDDALDFQPTPPHPAPGPDADVAVLEDSGPFDPAAAAATEAIVPGQHSAELPHLPEGRTADLDEAVEEDQDGDPEGDVHGEQVFDVDQDPHTARTEALSPRAWSGLGKHPDRDDPYEDDPYEDDPYGQDPHGDPAGQPTTIVPPLPAQRPRRAPADAESAPSSSPHSPSPHSPSPRSPSPREGMLPRMSGSTGRVPSARSQRRLQARQARTPTESLGRTSPRRWWIWGALLLILTAVLALVGWYFGSGPGGLVTVPDVTGHDRASALQELEELGMGYEVLSAHDDRVAPDSVLATDPAGGASVPRYTTVSVTLSAGPELFAVPVLTGLTEQEARSAVRESELGWGEVEREHSETVDAGVVLRQSPAPQAELRRDRPVTVVVSAGPEPVQVPDVRGLDLRQARQSLEDAGLQMVEGEPEHSVDVEAGLIAAQSPAEGELVPGESVVVVESLGPVLVDLPDVEGLPVEQAQAQLEELGLQVEVRRVLGGLFGDGGGEVRNQHPTPGTTTPEGSTVTLWVY